MKNKFKELGYGLISCCLFQIALSIVSIKTLINFIQLKNYTNTSAISYPQLIIEIILNILLIISVILLIFRKKISIIIYVISILASLILSACLKTLNVSSLFISLILPALTLLIIYIKRNLFV